jgi:hypothetical protein
MVVALICLLHSSCRTEKYLTSVITLLVHKLLHGLQGREGDAQLSGHHFICSPLHLESLKMLGICKNRERGFVYV